MGTGSLPAVKWLGHGANHACPSSAEEVNERVEVYLYSPLSIRPVEGSLYLSFYLVVKLNCLLTVVGCGYIRS
jgi:hypothetical protein